MEKLKRLQDFAVPANTSWEIKARERQKNRKWQKHSQDIALRILRILRSTGTTQSELAVRMNVSAQQITKIVKGTENLSLETIGKIETALGVSLFALPEYKHVEMYMLIQQSVAVKPKEVFTQILYEEQEYVYSKSTITNKKPFSSLF